jgi:hypothetical protein
MINNIPVYVVGTSRLKAGKAAPNELDTLAEYRPMTERTPTVTLLCNVNA